MTDETTTTTTVPVTASDAAPAAAGQLVLDVEKIHTFYGQIEALKGISVKVRQGEIVTLIGANGAGKSTTLKTISGLLAPREGSITFMGQTISGMKVHDVTKMGVIQVPEGRRIFPRMTVEENLEMGAFLRVKDAAAVKESMEQAYTLFPRLRERRTQKGGTLSGGEQQMLAMGRGIMADPKLLMLDEPSMGLAPVVVETIFETIEKLNKEGITILLVEQNAAMALSIADRGYVLETGKVVLEGPGKELLHNEKVRKTYLGEA
ncbi:MAG: ABC transporter ATP-binding protein [Coriobacteriia bacterium]|nr:ABC transporter ATP-binding protein [Coriobacteriia bacterium]